ncbi:unnamed protein product [Calypogeia fissa]
MSEDLEKRRKDLEAQYLNLPGTVDELSLLLEAIKKKLETTREEAESRKEKGKRQWGEKAEGENDSQKDEKAEGESELSSKLLASANGAEKVLQTISDIGKKPSSTTSGNRVASEYYNLLHEILKGLGNLHYAAVGLSMVAYVLERVNLVKDNSGKCLELLQTMFNLGQDMVNAYQYLPEAGYLLRSFIIEITKGVLLCCNHTQSGFLRRFGFATVNKNEFDSLSKTMTGLSEQLQRASQFAVMKGNKEMSNQLKELTKLNKATLQVIRPTEDEERETSKPGARPDNFQHLPKQMVDMDDEVEEIASKLETVRVLRLAGMGGLGKTTLAKVIFNKLVHKFDYTCFVSEVKLINGREEVVKREVWKCLHFQGRKVGGECNWDVLRGKKLLLVLDDISDQNRNSEILLDLAKDTDPGSRFILTSRKHYCLKNLGEVHRVDFWGRSRAESLFIKHAFSEPAVPCLETLGHFVEAIVDKCDGLPLALEVVGNFLRGNEKEVWKGTLSALERAEKVRNINKKLRAKLRVSFENLEEGEQQLFLDATNFFIGNRNNWSLSRAKMVWRAAYGPVSDRWWQTLVDTSLVYDVDDKEAIRVHEQLQSLGRMIASDPIYRAKYKIYRAKYKIFKGKKVLEMFGTSDAPHGKEVHALPSLFQKPAPTQKNPRNWGGNSKNRENPMKAEGKAKPPDNTKGHKTTWSLLDLEEPGFQIPITASYRIPKLRQSTASYRIPKLRRSMEVDWRIQIGDPDALVFVFVVIMVIFMVWYERRPSFGHYTR